MTAISFPPSNVDELLFHMPTVARAAKSGWAKDFAGSVLRQSRRRGWQPSEKQLAVMRKLVGEMFYCPGSADDDVTLIE
jgi:hypothetical protein